MMFTPMTLSEAEAIQLFSNRAADARGAVVVGPRDAKTVREIVRLLGFNKVAIVLAAARADVHDPKKILDDLRLLDGLSLPDPKLRDALVTGAERRRAGRLADAERLLVKVVRSAGQDRFAEAEALRHIGAVYRADGRLAEALQAREQALAIHEALGDRVHVAIARGEVGASLATVGRLNEARGFHEAAIALHRELGRHREEGVEWSLLGVALHRRGRFGDARRAHERALEIHRAVGNPRGEAADVMHLAYVAHELGELEVARAGFVAALERLRRVGDRSLEGVSLSYHGALEIEAGRPEEAGALLEQAMLVHREVKSRRHQAVTHLHLALHHMALGDAAASERALKRALSLTPVGMEVEHRAFALAVAGQHLDAAALHVEDEVSARAVALLAAAARVAGGEGDLGAARRLAIDVRGTGNVLVGSRVRFALAALERALRAVLPTLAVAFDGTRFRSERGTVVTLGRRAPLVNVLRHLVERRRLAPGEAQSAEVLVGVGWPGERVLHEAGRLRVRSALAELRRLGLRSAIVTRGGGYLLDPAFPIEALGA